MVFEVEVYDHNEKFVADYLFETKEKAEEYINDKVIPIHYSQLSEKFQNEYFRYSGKSDNVALFDRSGTLIYFSGPPDSVTFYILSEISPSIVDMHIEDGRAGWLAKDEKSGKWFTC